MSARRNFAAYVAAALITVCATPVFAQHHGAEKVASKPEAHAAPAKPAAPADAKPVVESPQVVAERIMKAIREYGAATQSRKTEAPQPAATPSPRYRVEWPPYRYTLLWPADDDRVTVVWP